jgi:hypothetical protein
VVTFTVAIRNADAPGKNLSLLHPAPGIVSLAPLYDTVPTVMWRKLPARAAMWITRGPPGGGDPRRHRRRGVPVEPLCGDGRAAAVSIAEGLLAALHTTEVPEDLADTIRARVTDLLTSQDHIR